MADAFAAWVLRILRVPPEPHLPPGAPGTARVFRAGRNYWNLLVIAWALRQAMALAGLVVFTSALLAADHLPATTAAGTPPAVGALAGAGVSLLKLLELFGWIAWIAQLPVTYRITRLGYELRWYIVTDRAARLREGIVSMREMTFTLANVQDIRIRQGPVQRLLGLSDVELRTAGGSDAPGGPHGKENPFEPNLHVARFTAVENAEEIRDLVRERMKHARGAGLGDPDDTSDASEERDASSLVLAAAARLEAEARALREASDRLAARRA